MDCGTEVEGWWFSHPNLWESFSKSTPEVSGKHVGGTNATRALCFSFFLPHTVYLRGGHKETVSVEMLHAQTRQFVLGAMPSYPLCKRALQNITVLTVGSPKILRCADDASYSGGHVLLNLPNLWHDKLIKLLPEHFILVRHCKKMGFCSNLCQVVTWDSLREEDVLSWITWNQLMYSIPTSVSSKIFDWVYQEDLERREEVNVFM